MVGENYMGILEVYDPDSELFGLSEKTKELQEKMREDLPFILPHYPELRWYTVEHWPRCDIDEGIPEAFLQVRKITSKNLYAIESNGIEIGLKFREVLLEDCVLLFHHYMGNMLSHIALDHFARFKVGLSYKYPPYKKRLGIKAEKDTLRRGFVDEDILKKYKII